jgi:hypothetical protein
MKMAKLGAVDHWMAATEVAVSAVQCWTSIEESLGALHHHEHDERRPALQRLRSGYLRRPRHARAAAGFADAVGAARMEQQLRRRSQQGSCSNLPKHFFRSVKMDF